MDLDLNLEPTDQTLPPETEIASFINELDRAQELMQARLRYLRGIHSRQRQQERDSVENNPIPNETNLVINTGFPSSIDTSLTLVSKASEIDLQPEKPDDKDSGSFYDCNICLEMAADPVLTCCGHLFCWACFYQVPKVDQSSKECPVCKGEVSETAVIPIYGNGGINQTESALKIPPRPKAPRVESLRQQLRVSHEIPYVPVEEALRLIGVGVSEDILNQEGVRNVEPQSGPRLRIRRVLSEREDSLTSLATYLNNAERLVEQLETVISSQMVDSSLYRGLTDLRAELGVHLDLGSESNSAALIAEPYSLRRSRRVLPRNSDVESGDTRGSRRRRLN